MSGSPPSISVTSTSESPTPKSFRCSPNVCGSPTHRDSSSPRRPAFRAPRPTRPTRRSSRALIATRRFSTDHDSHTWSAFGPTTSPRMRSRSSAGFTARRSASASCGSKSFLMSSQSLIEISSAFHAARASVNFACSRSASVRAVSRSSSSSSIGNRSSSLRIRRYPRTSPAGTPDPLPCPRLLTVEPPLRASAAC